MSYTPKRSSLGYIQASPVVSSSSSDVVFDIANDMNTVETAGTTSLTENSIIILRLSRNNDGVTNRSTVYYVNSGLTDFRYRGRTPSESNNLFQISEDAFDYANTINCTQAIGAGSGNISFTNHSHCRLWRLST